MTKFSPSDSALEGFRITRERPGTILAWSLVYFLGIMVIAMIMVTALGPDFIKFVKDGYLQSGDAAAVGTILEQHWLARLTDFGEERKVLHVSRTDLNHVGVAHYFFNFTWVHHFSHDRHAKFITDVAQDFQAFFAHPLIGIRTRARFVGTAAEDVRSGGNDVAADVSHPLFRFNGTRPSDHRQVPAADFDTGHIDNRRFFLSFKTGKFIRWQNRYHAFDSMQRLERCGVGFGFVADDADHGPKRPGTHVSTQTE